MGVGVHRHSSHSSGSGSCTSHLVSISMPKTQSCGAQHHQPRSCLVALSIRCPRALMCRIRARPARAFLFLLALHHCEACPGASRMLLDGSRATAREGISRRICSPFETISCLHTTKVPLAALVQAAHPLIFGFYRSLSDRTASMPGPSTSRLAPGPCVTRLSR
jgi:hypothetical protein